MKINVFDTKEALFENLSQFYATEIQKNPKINLGLATGSTPVPLYKKLIEDHKKNLTSYKDVKTFNLDEYIGLSSDHSQSYRTFMTETLFNGIDIKIKNTHIPSGVVKDLEKECIRYDKLIEENPIDIQLLGIGTNAHIGFHEPGYNLDSKTIIVDLAQETLDANVRFFDSMDEVPKRAITMGIGIIMQAKQIILVATGANKADAIYNTVKGLISKNVPASALQTHQNVVLYLDKEAASKL